MKRFLLKIFTLASIMLGAATPVFADAIVARVDIGAQTMTVSKGGRMLYNWRVSTARKGYYTPRGTYRPTRTHRMWYSRKYEMSPMPYSVFFNGGYAIHGTGYVKQLGRPASHGCVRLATANAARFYQLVKEYGHGNVRIVLVN